MKIQNQLQLAACLILSLSLNIAHGMEFKRFLSAVSMTGISQTSSSSIGSGNSLINLADTAAKSAANGGQANSVAYQYNNAGLVGANNAGLLAVTALSAANSNTASNTGTANSLGQAFNTLGSVGSGNVVQTAGALDSTSNLNGGSGSASSAAQQTLDSSVTGSGSSSSATGTSSSQSNNNNALMSVATSLGLSQSQTVGASNVVSSKQLTLADVAANGQFASSNSGAEGSATAGSVGSQNAHGVSNTATSTSNANP
eukprot:GILJ01010536.1.p1 GENE.GILJ01010536.1~~GILJ01010536.1.p1  ORF type:complete len:257 (+),score=48.07 GILJ01010536.1:190-960(+)